MNDKWEYQVLNINCGREEFEARLNSLGQEGWELLTHGHNINFSLHYCTLKRKIS